MKTIVNNENLAEFKQKLTNLCWADADFKNRLVTDPRKVLKEVRVDISDDLKITINDYTDASPDVKFEVSDYVDASVLNINIPPLPESYDLELSDKELEVISGGSTSWFGCQVCKPK